MVRTIHLMFLPSILAGPALADPPRECPPAVAKAIATAFARSTIVSCKAEREHGKDLVEVKLTSATGSHLEVDVALDGTILQVEEPIAVDALPAAVKSAFAARYPRAKASAAEKQTAGKAVRYEIAFDSDNRRREASFTADGTFIAED